MTSVTFTIAGASRRLILEGSPGQTILNYVRDAKLRKVGRGTQATITMPADLAQDLSDYLYSIEGVVGDMTASEREGGREAETAWRARATIDFALTELEARDGR